MTMLFEDRERAAEWAFAHEGEVRFLAHCSALKALASYAATRMDLSDDAARDYAKRLVAAAVDGAKDDALIERVRADLAGHGIAETAEALRARLVASLAQAALHNKAAP